jgi:hypothetical protein
MRNVQRIRCRCVTTALILGVLFGRVVWLSTFIQRCVEHNELVQSCAERLEASQPKPGEPCPVPGGTVATYGPGLAPLEYARLTGLMSRYATTESSVVNVENSSEGQIEHGTLADVPAPWKGNDTAVSSPSSRSGTTAGDTVEKGEAVQTPPGVPSRAQAQAPALSASRGVVYPRHLPELKVQKLPKCAFANRLRCPGRARDAFHNQ